MIFQGNSNLRVGGTEHGEREGIDPKLLQVKYTEEFGALGFRDT